MRRWTVRGNDRRRTQRLPPHPRSSSLALFAMACRRLRCRLVVRHPLRLRQRCKHMASTAEGPGDVLAQRRRRWQSALPRQLLQHQQSRRPSPPRQLCADPRHQRRRVCAQRRLRYSVTRWSLPRRRPQLRLFSWFHQSPVGGLSGGRMRTSGGQPRGVLLEVIHGMAWRATRHRAQASGQGGAPHPRPLCDRSSPCHLRLRASAVRA